MDFKYRCGFKLYGKLLEFSQSASVENDIQRSIGKCIFHSIMELIAQCVICEDEMDYEFQVKELIKTVKGCAECQNLNRNFFRQYYLPIDRESVEVPIFDTKIKFADGQIRFRATLAWALRKCSTT